MTEDWFLSRLKEAAMVAAENCRKMSRSMSKNSQGVPEFEATIKAMIYHELRMDDFVNWHEMSLEVGYPTSSGKWVEADLTYCRGGAWESAKDSNCYVAQIVPVKSKGIPLGRILDEAKKLSAMQEVRMRILIVPVIGAKHSQLDRVSSRVTEGLKKNNTGNVELIVC